MHEDQARRSVAVEAARLISQSGLRDYRQAKLKAAERLGLPTDANLPRNSEIEDALREHQRLFLADAQPRIVRALREVAQEAMRFFARHEPRLVGAVLDGTADRHSAVCLHLYTDQPLDVLAQLHAHGIPYREQTRRLRLDRTTTRDVPALLFSADDTAIDITVLPYDALRQAPLDRITEKPMHRASAAALETLLHEAG
ncbi:MAG: hypothetical protein LBQ20_07725 [Rhodanobacter sp.]|jgi:hypothetical protein|nr:hypothetical protein [Rhodanobacter sp.]